MGIVCALSLVVTTTACGALGYVKGVTFDASSSVAAAKSVDAAKYAPYEYTRALEYLHKAREEAGNADFQAANRFGELAYNAANEAKKLAIKRAANTNDTDWMPPESLRDGKSPASGDAKPEGDGGDGDGEGGEGDAGDGEGGEGDAGDGDADADTGDGDDKTENSADSTSGGDDQ